MNVVPFGGLASVAETRFGFCPFCGAEMDGDSDD